MLDMYPDDAPGQGNHDPETLRQHREKWQLLPRCPRCKLLLPCGSCLPVAADFARDAKRGFEASGAINVSRTTTGIRQS